MTKQIAIDLTPLRPGGTNGGAKTLIWELLHHFQTLTPDFSFLLLTADWNHNLLARFDGPGFSRLCVLSSAQQEENGRPRPSPLREELFQAIRRRLPLSLITHLRPSVQWLKSKISPVKRPSPPPQNIYLLDMGIDLLYCPFTAVTYAEPHLPTISFVHDLQHRVYPQFFDPAELAGREATYLAMAHRADLFVCNSAYTRQTLLEQFSNISPDQVLIIPISIHTRLTKLEPSLSTPPTPRPYLFYPANFWPHKNHRMLLTAYNTLRHQRPNLNLDLVFTGAESSEMETLKTAVNQMNLADHVHFLGFLPDEALAAVYQFCQAVIYPSLYEGFGIPLLEAFSFNKPVLCSHETSLPEVAGDGAIYFNPRKPTEIMTAIKTLLDNPTTQDNLIKGGQERLAHYKPAHMVAAYRDCFEQTGSQKSEPQDALHGRYEDGWLGAQASFIHQPDHNQRHLILTLFTPPWQPNPILILSYRHPETEILTKFTLIRGERRTVKIPLSPKGGRLTLNFSPTFQPSQHEGTVDTRQLSCILQEWQIEV